MHMPVQCSRYIFMDACYVTCPRHQFTFNMRLSWRVSRYSHVMGRDTDVANAEITCRKVAVTPTVPGADGCLPCSLEMFVMPIINNCHARHRYCTIVVLDITAITAQD